MFGSHICDPASATCCDIENVKKKGEIAIYYALAVIIVTGSAVFLKCRSVTRYRRGSRDAVTAAICFEMFKTDRSCLCDAHIARLIAT